MKRFGAAAAFLVCLCSGTHTFDQSGNASISGTISDSGNIATRAGSRQFQGQLRVAF